eukprot:Rhum_TRINITY_DN13700_c0_g1::Rhum_TRINITY_DN13700_c0_g1_i1::g.63143::m.63143
MTGSSVVMLLADLSPQALTELRAAVRTDAGKRTAFRDCGGVELLLSRLGSSSSSSSAGSAKARAELLFTLAFCCDDEARTYVRDAGGLGTAAALLRETLDAPDAFECCTYAVGLLASHSHSSRVALVEAGALATLAAALPAAAPPRPRLARAACCRTVLNVANVVRTLCEECRPAKEAAVAEGVVAGLCAAAVQEPQVAPCALSALAAAVYKCPPAQAAFLGSAAFAVLPELLLSTTPPSLEASRCLYAAGPAAATAVGEAVAAAGVRRTPDLHRSLAAAAAEFAAREARGVAAAAAAATAATDGAAAAASAPTRVVPYVGGAALSVAGVAAVLRPGDTMLSVELGLGDVELVVHAVEVQRGGAAAAAAAVTLSLRNEAGAEVCGAKDGASSLLWRCCREGEEAGAATQTAVYSVMVEGGCGGGDVAVAVYANGHDGEAGGLRGIVARVPAPPAPPAAEAAAAAAAPVRSSETEELSRQVADLAKKVSRFEVAPPQPPPPQATESPPQPQPDSQAALLAEDNRALKRRIGDMERESMDARRELVASRHMVERLSRQQQPPPSLRRDSFASSASGMSSASASSLGALNEEVESVTRQLEHLDAECEANNNELGRFLTQLTQLRERMGGGGASRASCDTLG